MADGPLGVRGQGMKFRARTSGESGRAPVPVEVASGAPRFRVSVDGRTVSGQAVSLETGVWSLVFEDGRQIEVSLEPAADGTVQARFGAARASFELQDELTALASASGGKGRSRKGDVVTAAIPGRVLRVSIAPGEAISAGQPLLVLEAMKMENEVKAPRDGVVESVAVTAGQAVSAGEVLARLRPES
jgi:biotin carboxyl carrier protein